MAGKKREKGEYRALYAALPDDPDFQDLSGVARAAFYPLKLKLGIGGIGVFYTDTLPRFTGFTLAQTDAAVAELERGDWIRRERNVIWIRNGLRHDPLEPLASPNGRKGVEHFLRSLPKLAIVNEFARYYGLPVLYPDVAGAEAPYQAPTEAPSQGDTPPLGQHGVRKTEDGEHLSVSIETDEPSIEKNSANGTGTPLTTARLNLLRGEAIASIRATWSDGVPPREWGRGKNRWTTAREGSIWNQLMKYDAPDSVNAAIAAGIKRARGHPFSLAFFRADKPSCQEYYRQMLTEGMKAAESGPRQVRIEVVR